MATITQTETFTTTVTAAKLNNIAGTATVSDIVNADCSTSMGLVDTKLATIATAGKVNTSALVTTSQAAGDILYGNGTGYVRLAVGTAGQYLKVKAGATELEWGA
jgi:hypothetical protein